MERNKPPLFLWNICKVYSVSVTKKSTQVFIRQVCWSHIRAGVQIIRKILLLQFNVSYSFKCIWGGRETYTSVQVHYHVVIILLKEVRK